MSRIIILDGSIVSKIAAGEVIERPASLVKELVENSIDAGAKNITIEVKDGGKRSVKVVDDGCGMDPADAELSIEKHATSKLKSAEELFSIRTLGFRGEALSSIAAVSRFELVTCDGKKSGTRIKAEGGKIISRAGEGCPAGTSVTVEDLFFNTPARLKFLKGKSTELSNIADLVSKFILSNPGISFHLKSDGQEILSSVGSGNLLDSIAAVYGIDMSKAMLKVGDARCETGDVRVHGYSTQPVITKSDRYGESFFVNGRFVRNALLSRALEVAYSSLIPSNKYPIAVIFVDIDPADVDVNVHPAKREVKFSRPDVVMKAMTSAVSAALKEVSAGSGAGQYDGSRFDGSNNWKPEMIKIFGETANDLPAGRQGQYQMTNETPMTNEQTGALFQLTLTYIIMAKGEDLVMIDQHAAHERIMYEKIKNRVIAGTQSLLVPKTLELEPREFALISDNLGEIKGLGFDIEAFGKNTVIVRGIPAALKIQNIDTAISGIISELSASFNIKSIDERREAVWKMMACKSAVKAGDKLSYSEMEGLVKELYATENPTTCPHGRPTLAVISKASLEKMFGR